MVTGNLLYLLVAGVLLFGVEAIDSKTDNLLKTFEQSEFTVFASTNIAVYHMEEDLYKPSFILYNGGYAIKTSDGSTPEIVAGHTEYRGYREGVGPDARFTYPSKFTQISADKLVVSDSTMHCLRLIDRATLNTSNWVGRCNQGGSGDGVGTSARFFFPSSVMVDKKDPNQLYVLDYRNQAIKTVQIDTKRVRILIKDRLEDNLARMQGMTQDDESGDILVSNDNFIYRIKYKSISLIRIAGSKTLSGFVDGRMILARFKSPRDMIQIGRLLFLVTDTGNKKIRLLDFDANNVTTRSICAKSLTWSPEQHNCQVPYSILVANNQLLIGTFTGIMRGGSMNRKGTTLKPITSQSNTTTPKLGSLATEPKNLGGSSRMTTSRTGLASIRTVQHNQGSSTPRPAVLDRCPTDLKVLTSASNDLATFVFTVSGNKHTVVLPEGRHPYTIEVANRKCHFYLIAEDYRKQNERQSLTFVALYDVDCKIINDSASFSLLKTIGKLRYTAIEDLCQSDCGRPTPDAEPIIDCAANNKLVIKWQTNKLYGLDVASVSASQLEGRIANKGPILDITIFGRTPPIVYPIKNKFGGYAKLELSPICKSGKRMAKKAPRCG